MNTRHHLFLGLALVPLALAACMPTSAELRRAEAGFIADAPPSRFDARPLSQKQIKSQRLTDLTDGVLLASYSASVIRPSLYGPQINQTLDEEIQSRSLMGRLDVLALQHSLFSVGMPASAAVTLVREKDALVGPLVVKRNDDQYYEKWKIGDTFGRYFYGCFYHGKLQQVSKTQYDVRIKHYSNGVETNPVEGNIFLLPLEQASDGTITRIDTNKYASDCSPPTGQKRKLPEACTGPRTGAYNFSNSPVLGCHDALEAHKRR